MLHELLTTQRALPMDVTTVNGAEWWYQVKVDNESINFHYDKDEGLASAHGRMRHPLLSTVTYIRAVGGPTVIFNQSTIDGNVDVPVIPESAHLVYPKAGRHVIFQGGLQHGVVGELSHIHQDLLKRVTLLINWWDLPVPLEPNTQALRTRPLTKMGLYRPHDVKKAVEVKGGAGAGKFVEEEWRGLAVRSEINTSTVELRIPPGDVLLFRWPKHDTKEEGLYHVAWEKGQVYGNFAYLDLQNSAQVNALFRATEAKLLVFYQGQEMHDRIRFFLPTLASRYVGQVKFLLAQDEKCRDAMTVFDVDGEEFPVAVIHQTNPMEKKLVMREFTGPRLDEGALKDFIDNYLRGDVESYVYDEL